MEFDVDAGVLEEFTDERDGYVTPPMTIVFCYSATGVFIRDKVQIDGGIEPIESLERGILIMRL